MSDSRCALPITFLGKKSKKINSKFFITADVGSRCCELLSIYYFRHSENNLIQDFQENIWKNGFNSVTLQQLDNIIKDIQNGRIETDTDRRLRRIAECWTRTDNGRVVGNYYRPRNKSVPLIAAQICGGSSRAAYKRPHSYYREKLLIEWGCELLSIYYFRPSENIVNDGLKELIPYFYVFYW